MSREAALLAAMAVAFIALVIWAAMRPGAVCGAHSHRVIVTRMPVPVATATMRPVWGCGT